MKRWILVVALLIFVPGCGAAKRHHVQLYSGGECVRQWTSEGDVRGVDGKWFFTDAADGSFVSISENIVITERR